MHTGFSKTPTSVTLKLENSYENVLSTLGPYFAILGPMALTSACFLRSLGLSLGLGLLACGGTVETAPAADLSGLGGDAASSGAGPQLLSDCGPSFPKSQASTDKPCNFLVGDTCYSTQDDACGCICPRDQGSLMCVTGQDDTQRVAGLPVMWVVCHASPS
jgi:hypothetical protein